MKPAPTLQRVITDICAAHNIDIAAVLRPEPTHYQHIHLRIENPPYMALVIETPAPQTVSVSHYGELNGDLMADPDVMLWCSPVDGKWYPFRYRLDYAGLDRESIFFEDGKPHRYIRRYQHDLATFCTTWARNLKGQGFI